MLNGKRKMKFELALLDELRGELGRENGSVFFDKLKLIEKLPIILDASGEKVTFQMLPNLSDACLFDAIGQLSGPDATKRIFGAFQRAKAAHIGNGGRLAGTSGCTRCCLGTNECIAKRIMARNAGKGRAQAAAGSKPAPLAH